MLSPAELFAARSRDQTLPQRSHGQKDFLLDNSNLQEDNLLFCRTEQWELLREERVERLGNLGRGVWKPEEDLVELTLPAGKFWQTMGFNEGGRQCLYPEEAVYLLECGSIRLFYRELPLSVQEAYEKLLSGGSVTLLHYQVYSHLKRLGYIVTRFNSSSVQAPYERWLNLDTCVAPSRKRKRSSSPCLKSKPNDDEKEKDNFCFPSPPVCGTAMKEDPCAAETINQKTHVGNDMASCSLSTVFESPTRISQTAGHKDSRGITYLGNCRWDFSKIYFPNCAPDQPCVDLPKPESILLPENVLGHPANISHWLQKLNLSQEKFSRREQEQLEWERKYKININADPGVKKCTSWREYKYLLQERTHQKNRERPPHLWKSTVQPLLWPASIKSTASVLEEITLTSQSTLLDDGKRLKSMQSKPKIQFNLYHADRTSEFKKSKPGKPYAHLCVRSFDEQIPSILTLKTLAYHSGDVPVVFALVDFGEVSFYTFKDFQLPVDVYP